MTSKNPMNVHVTTMMSLLILRRLKKHMWPPNVVCRSQTPSTQDLIAFSISACAERSDDLSVKISSDTHQ